MMRVNDHVISKEVKGITVYSEDCLFVSGEYSKYCGKGRHLPEELNYCPEPGQLAASNSRQGQRAKMGFVDFLFYDVEHNEPEVIFIHFRPGQLDFMKFVRNGYKLVGNTIYK